MSVSRSVVMGAVALVVGSSTGCSLSQEKFQDRYYEAVCEHYVACYSEDDYAFFTFEDVDECVAFFSAFADDSYYDDCDYDSSAAKECINGIEDYAGQCDADDSDYEDAAEACEQVYDCPDSGGEDTSDTGR